MGDKLLRWLWVSVVVSCVVLSSAAAGEGPVKFTREPTARRDGDKVAIEFALDRETDVAVYIEDAEGKIVRHLVAGVLGKNPPAPLQPDSLSQVLEWDGKDDTGKPARGGPFKVRVSAGTRGEFDRFLLYNPDASGPVTALAVGPKGNLYLFHRDATANGNMGTNKIKIVSREGNQLRALMPFPADIAPEKVKPLGVFRTKEGDLVPRVHNYEQLSFYPDPLGSRGRSMPDCSSPVVDSKGRLYWLVKGPALASLDADGGVPYESFIGPRLLPEVEDLRMANRWMFWRDAPCLALSSDGKHLYFAGLFVGKFGKDETHRPLPCVFRVELEKRAPGEVFLGKLDTPGKEKGLLTAPRGLAVANGLLYVADTGAGRIAVFKESDRSFVADIRLENPQSIAVDPTTGAIYVCTYTGKQTADLVKFDNLESGKEVCRMALPKTGLSPNPGVHRIALDCSGKPVLIWVPNLPWSPYRQKLLCIEDASDEFAVRDDPRSQEPWAEGPRDLSLDRLRGELYVKVNYQKWYRIDEKTGEVKDLVDIGAKHNELRGGAMGTQLVPGPDGNLYTWSWSRGLWRFDHEGNTIDWQGQSTHHIDIGGMMCFQIRHLAFRRPDELFVVPPPRHYAEGRKVDSRFTSLNVIGPDGKRKRTVVWQCLIGAIPRLDAKGNIYLADMVKPPERSYPEFFDGKLEPPTKSGPAAGDRFWTSYIYASIVKFPPTGGAIWYREELPPGALGQPPAELQAKPRVNVNAHIGYQRHSPAELQGALWYRFGYAPYSATSSTSTDTCMCEGSGFDVDPFGRVFFPNLGQFRVEVIDTNNNPITRFGKYGNQDSGGRDASVSKPDIPLAWPVYVVASDTHAYVADTVNRRVVAVKLTYAAEARCAVP